MCMSDSQVFLQQIASARCSGRVLLRVPATHFLHFHAAQDDGMITFALHMFILVLIGLLLSIPGPCIRTMLMNVNRPHCRSTVIAISEVFNNIGRILGPVLFVYYCQ